jgi:hypothetical protein
VTRAVSIEAMTDLQELRALLAEATPGSWLARRWVVTMADEETEIGVFPNPDDAALIVAAVNALPALLDRLEQAEGEVEHLVAANEHWHVRVIALNSTNDQLTERLEQAEARNAKLERVADTAKNHKCENHTSQSGTTRWCRMCEALAALNEPGEKP